MRAPILVAGVVIAAAIGVRATDARQERPGGQGFSFRTGVELINVTATVTDAQGRFVGNLRADDFELYEDGKRQQIQQFDAERVPVSLGIALDTSGSMLGEKIAAAQAALNRFLFDLLGNQDEVFLYRFDSRPDMVQSWTSDRQAVARALGTVRPNGGTAMYDTVAEALPLAQSGTRRKKALVVISDGNDTSSRTRIDDLRQLIRETEVLVYAIGIDGTGETATTAGRQPPPRLPIPIPFPGGRRPGGWPPSTPPLGGGWPRTSVPNDDRVNVVALRDMTDDSGGRTEIVRDPRDLNPATANVADELSKQYYLGYPSPGKKDGRWHSIRVEVRKGNYRVRARRGYVAS